MMLVRGNAKDPVLKEFRIPKLLAPGRQRWVKPDYSL
jgi:hypothetical protein